MTRLYALFVWLLVAASAAAQQAFVVEITKDQYVGILIAADGTVHAITKLTILKPAVEVATPVKATYVYEKDANPVPPGVAAALQKLNAEKKIVATEFEEDTVDGTGEVPAQYKSTLDAAKQTGIPCLVVQDAKGNVVRTVKSPTTEAQIMEAVK